MPNYNPPKENFFKTERPESCTALINVRVPPSLKAKLKNIDNWQEKVRQALAEVAETSTNKAA